jgi:hypothetical protein
MGDDAEAPFGSDDARERARSACERGNYLVSP